MTSTSDRAVTAWVSVVALGGLASVTSTALWSPGGGGDTADPIVALLLVAGVAGAVLTPIRYRLGASTHGVTADEALLVAMLIAVPGPLPPLLHVGGVIVGHLVLRTRPQRLLFNAGLVGLASSAATIMFRELAHQPAGVTFEVGAAALAAMALYAIVTALTMAELLRRLGASTFWAGVADVLPVSRVTLPANILAGLALGWLALRSRAEAIIGLGGVLIAFASYRAYVGVRQQRDRASRLREVAMALVAASGSLDAFDEALLRIARLFGAQACELLLADGEHRHVSRQGQRHGDAPSPAAVAALELERAATFGPGTPEGGEGGALAAPILGEGRAIGCLVLHDRRGLEPWDDTDQDVLDGVAGEVHVALQNAELVEAIETERAHLAAQTELLGGVLEAASDGIALIGEDGDVLAWNPAMSDIARPNQADAVGASWRDVLRAVDADGDSEPVASAVKAAMAGQTLGRTWQIVPPTGDPRWVRVVLSPALAADRPAVVLVARDVTAAREVDRLKTDFIATVSHELRTPLTPIKGYIELNLRRDLPLDQRQEMMTAMKRQVGRLELLIDDLLSMAQLDRNLVDVEHETVALREVLTQVHSKHVLSGRVMPHSEDVQVKGDLAAIIRIVDALVDNALKHTEGAVQVVVGRGDGVGVVTVTDQGEGIPTSDQEMVFEAFGRRGDHLLRTQGPGLGLSIARALARRLGGEVTLRSKVGEGSSFELSLPLA